MADRSPITDGVDFNRFLDVGVTGAVFPAEADALLLIRGPSISFYMKNAGAADVEYSFNGTTVHGRLLAGTERFYPFRRVSKVWFRAAGPTTVEIEAWATA